jgi:hypothetical protein
MSKYLENFCQEIKELISQIFGARQKLKEMAQVADQEGRRASGISFDYSVNWSEKLLQFKSKNTKNRMFLALTTNTFNGMKNMV